MMREWLIVALFVSCCFISPVTAIEEETDPFVEAGLSLVALRNDSLDTDQDGMMDAIRVVVVLNSTATWTDLTLSLIGHHAGMVVEEQSVMSFANQENSSLTYDSWAEGEHSLTLEISDVEGQLLVSIPLGVFDLSPALSVPDIDLRLSGSEVMETGDPCEIRRVFIDQTGPRWDKDGTRSITGTPFTVLDSEEFVDCSTWPAGVYTIKETYGNGLGQTTSDELEIVIANKPPPSFKLNVNGDSLQADTPCNIVHVPSPGEDHSEFTKSWTITPSDSITIGNYSNLDCSTWSSGVYKVLLTVTNHEGIKATSGSMLVRLPPATMSAEESLESPQQSSGSDTVTSNIGWYGIIALSLILGAAVFLIMLRSPEQEVLVDGMMYDESGQPDSEGLPTHIDESGVLWRKHDDGEVDWWDRASFSWKRW